MVGVHGPEFSRKHASAKSKCIFGGPAGWSCTRKSAFAPRTIDYDLARRDGGLLGRRAILFHSTTVGKSWRRVGADILKIWSQNRRFPKNPPFRSGRASYQMEMSITACDPEKERSRKILQPENDLAQDFQKVALVRVLFTGPMFFDKNLYQARVGARS